jgi:anti-sigma B factor antagonist
LRTLEHRTASSSVSNNSQTTSLLRIDEHRVGRRAVLTAVGEVDISSAADLQRALETARDGGAAEIWLDLTRTSFMDCNGLRALLALHTSLRAADRRLVVICPAGPVLRLLVLTGADHELEIHPTRTAACDTPN